MKLRTRRVRMLGGALAAGAAFGAGAVWRHQQWFPYRSLVSLRDWASSRGEPRAREGPPGFWVEDRGVRTLEGLTADELEDLRAVGYLQAYEAGGTERGLVLRDAARAAPGCNLWISSHAPTALLMDEAGRPLHEWHCAFESLWPEDFEALPGQDAFRRVHLLENGDLLAIFSGWGLVKLDRESRVLWKQRGQFHHDLWIEPDGRIYVLLNQPRVNPLVPGEKAILDDGYAVLTPEGETREVLSFLDAFQDSPYAATLERLRSSGDVFHTNSIQVLDGKCADRSPAWKQGNVLVSIRELDAVAVVDPERRAVVWAATGMWHKQHEALLLENGNLLLFDNRGHRGRSKVLELDPLRMEIRWAYESTDANGFFSELMGCSQRLENGNTLITESLAGRAFEVTPEGEIVWDFYNTFRLDDHVAVLATVERLPADFPLDWVTTQR